MANLTVSLIFWFALAWLAYTFVGYPVLIFCLSRISRRSRRQSQREQVLEVSVVLVAHNEQNRIRDRVANLLESHYPAEKLELIIVSDGSTDATVNEIKAHPAANVRLREIPERRGKAHALNVGVAAARGEIVVFADARQRFAPDTIARLVAHFDDPAIGAVSGALEIEPSASTTGGGVDAYWKLEKFIRYSESEFDSSIGCTGAVYAIRKSCYRELPEDTILDDVVTPMEIARQDKRVVFDKLALAFDPQTLEPGREEVRKRRTLSGNFQMLFRYPQWLVPWKNRLWWQLISHKYSRLTAPLCLAIVAVTNLWLADNTFYRGLLLCQAAFYLLAFMGMAFPGAKVRLLSLPAGFVFLNWMTVRGFLYYLFVPPEQAWGVIRKDRT